MNKKTRLTKVNLKCFIACAFSGSDVDEIYQKVLCPALKTFNIKPLRSDIPDHNDDIDDKIIELINDSDFCICDLTYARPSVYYEAGYAVGLNKPVIFTVRKDHLEPKADNHFENFKVHFDLQMKNIIDWKDVNDQNFAQKLKSRISLVIKPIDHKYQIQIEKKEADNAFQKLAETEKIIQIEKLVIKILQKNEYIISSNDRSDFRKLQLRFIRASRGSQQVSIHIASSLTRKLMENRWISFIFVKKDYTESVKIFLSVNPSRLNFSNLLPEFSKICQNRFYSERKDGAKEYITIIHGIKSIIDLEKEIVDLI